MWLELIRYLFFSKSGFSDWMVEKAKEDAAVRLISLGEMYELR